MCKEVQKQFDPIQEHDACGIGAVVNIDGRREHCIVDQALSIVERLEHRAGKDASGKVGDGVGILLQISHRFFKEVMRKQGVLLPDQGEYGIAMLFLPQSLLARRKAEQLFETISAHEGGTVLGWRDVACHSEILGESARACMPTIRQCFIARPKHVQTGLA